MTLTLAMAIFSILIILCLISSKLSSIFNMPTLIFFLAVGMLTGSEGFGWIDFDNATIANYVGSIALAFILFSGGYDTRFSEIKPILAVGTILSSLGVLLTAVGVAVFTYFFLGFVVPERSISFAWCLLLGSIISSTDAAAVFSILRSRSVSLRGKLRPLLEFESGSNDPMAAFLTIFMLDIVMNEVQGGGAPSLWSYMSIIPIFAQKMAIGVIVGYLIARMAVWFYNKINFEFDGLYYVTGFAVVTLTYALAEEVTGNGFMAVYIAGMYMGNKRFIFKNGSGRFFDGIAWLMQMMLFTMLGLLSSPKMLWEAKWTGLAVALFLMFIARPAAVYLCMLFSKTSWRERTLTAWVGLRGGAPIMLATFPLMMLPDSAGRLFMFHVVFFIVLTSVAIQGLTLMPFARLLKLDSPLRNRPREPVSFEHTGNMNAAAEEFEIPLSSPLIGKQIRDLHLPKGALIVTLRRKDEFIIPQGDTVVESGDGLMIVAPDILLEGLRIALTEVSA